MSLLLSLFLLLVADGFFSYCTLLVDLSCVLSSLLLVFCPSGDEFSFQMLFHKKAVVSLVSDELDLYRTIDWRMLANSGSPNRLRQHVNHHASGRPKTHAIFGDFQLIHSTSSTH